MILIWKNSTALKHLFRISFTSGIFLKNHALCPFSGEICMKRNLRVWPIHWSQEVVKIYQFYKNSLSVAILILSVTHMCPTLLYFSPRPPQNHVLDIFHCGWFHTHRHEIQFSRHIQQPHDQTVLTIPVSVLYIHPETSNYHLKI